MLIANEDPRPLPVADAAYITERTVAGGYPGERGLNLRYPVIQGQLTDAKIARS